MFVVSILLGVLPMSGFAFFVSWLDRYKKGRWYVLVFAFLWGLVIAGSGAYAINTMLNARLLSWADSATVREYGSISVIAPIVEEFLKGLAVVLIYWLARREFNSGLDGIIYGGITGLGFAATENTLYIYRYGFLTFGWAGLLSQTILRVTLIGWMHAFFTAFIGIGFALARLHRSVMIRIAAPLLGFGTAVFLHALHNSIGWVVGGFGGFLLGLIVDWLGFGGMIGLILWLIYVDYKIMKKQLKAEVTSGLISEVQYQKALIPLTLSFAIFSGGATLRFYQLLGRLAHTKEQFEHFGDEGGNVRMIRSLREELAGLATRVK
ncbi:MAG TPA: PrsW family intramembrane metalloprotease [Anaerolineales bacterium]|nr:PrsW family intramembrane metalloprotease [Anaerolineales bacterium]